jgi:hypothetical protein
VGPASAFSLALRGSALFWTHERLVRALFLATVACLALKLLAYDVVHRALLVS